MARPEARPGEDTRERILDCAEVLFAERGLAGTAVRDIAREAGLTPASLYNHFDGKQALYEAVLARGVLPLLELLRSLSAGGLDDGADDTLGAIMAHLARHPRLPRLIQHESLTGGAYLSKLGRRWLRPLIEQGLAAMKSEPDSPWSEDEHPRVISAWLYLIFGHFTLAPVLGVVFDEDPLSPENVDRQTRFLRKLARNMMHAREAALPSPPDPEGRP
jgi:AcrR family transcriptional regulator